MEEQLQLAKEQGDSEELMADQEDDAGGQEEVPDAPVEQSFAERVDDRMSPAQEVMEKEATPQVDKVMIGIKMSDEPSEDAPRVDMDKLYSIVYDEPYDASDAKAEGRMRVMQQAMEDPRVMAMAESDPEKFALFMYGRNSAIA